ncbi:MAG: hypothetical protein R3C56_09550 [Pirellulaceae bacterium]
MASLWLLHAPQPWLQLTTLVLAWGAVLITIASGVDYVLQAMRVLRSVSTQ